MAKKEKISITDLMDNAIYDENLVNSAVNKVHQQAYKKEKTVRATVDIPASFHKELKKFLIDESKELKTFCLEAIQEKYERLSSKTLDSLN